MSLTSTIQTNGAPLAEQAQSRIEHHLAGLEKRLEHHPDPQARVVLKHQPATRVWEVSLTLQLSPLGGHLVSHQTGETPDRAAQLAVKDIERQLERRHAQQRGEHSFGVPSRRLPRELRPHPPAAPTEEPDS